MEAILEVIRTTIKSASMKGILSWLFLKSHGDVLPEYKDFDVFMIIEDSDDVFSRVLESSSLAVQLTILTGKRVSIYPIRQLDIINKKTQFLKNITDMAVIL